MGLRESEAKIASLEASLASLESEDILQKEAIVKQIEEIRQTAYTHMDAWIVYIWLDIPNGPKRVIISPGCLMILWNCMAIVSMEMMVPVKGAWQVFMGFR